MINLYLGKATPDSVLAAAANLDPNKDRGRYCKAYFYLGEQALLEGKQAEAKRLFQQAVETGVMEFDECRGAQEELKLLSSKRDKHS